MTPLDALRRDLGDVLGWLLVREPSAGDLRLWVTVTRPPASCELGLVVIEGAASEPQTRVWEAQAASALQALGYQTGRRTWDHITVEHAPPAGELTAHRRLAAWRRVEVAFERMEAERDRAPDAGLL